MEWVWLAVGIGGALASVWAASSGEAEGRPRRARFVLTGSPEVFTVEMGGTVDGTMTRGPIGYSAWHQGPQPMQYVRLENIGDEPVENPWIIVNGKRNWRTIEDVVAEVVRPEMSDREKALRLWWFQVNHRFHAFTDDEENMDEIKVLNVYGYTLCGNDAEVLGHLFQAAGLKVRAGHPTGHCTTEVFWDGRWHLLDGDENIIVLLRDNHTIAGEEDIVRDHDLMKRTHTYGILSSDDRFRDEFSASLYTYEGERKPGRGMRTKHKMYFTLLPGEALEWRWESRGKYHGKPDLAKGWGERALERVANGRLIYRPDLRASYVRATAKTRNCVVGETDAEMPPVHVSAGAAEGSVDFPIGSPYPFVGGSFTATAVGRGKVSAVLVLGDKERPLAVAEVNGRKTLSADLDRLFPHAAPARYGAVLRLAMTQGAGFESFWLRFDLQMAPLSLPELELGRNEVRYVDDNQRRRVRVTFAWEELDFTRPPHPPQAPVFPADGATVEGTRICFRWRPAEDPDGDKIADYQFQLSERPDMAWPLSPNFNKLISNTADRGKAQYTLPYEGLLAPDRVYYWRVRAMDAKGVWGEWSRVWSFRCRAPAPPEGLQGQADAASGTIVLRWQPARTGTRPVRYRVYGSNEKGFSISDEPYEIMWTNMSSPKRRKMPANFLGETDETEMVVVGPQVSGDAANCAFYRVVAVDAAGVRSGPSDYIALPRPFIYTKPATVARPGGQYEYHAKSLFSLGDLRCRRLKKPDGTWNPYNAKFWDIEQVKWEKVEGPQWLSVDAESGRVWGTVPAGFRRAEVVIAASIEGVGRAEQRFEIRAGG